MKRRSIRNKLLTYFLAITLLPLLTLGVLGPVLYFRTIERETTSYTIQMIRQVTRNFEFYVHDMENIIFYLAQSPEIIDFLQRPSDASAKAGTSTQDALAVMRTYVNSHPEIAGILVVNYRDQLLSNEFERIARDPLSSDSWYREAASDPGTIHLFPRPIGRNIRGDSSDDVVSVVKAVRDERSGSIEGVILIDMKLKVVEDIFTNTKLGESGFIFIVDSYGETVYAPVNKVVYRVRNEWLTSGSDSVVRQINGSRYQLMWEDSTYTRWKTVGVFSLNDILREVNNIRYYAMLIAGLTVLCAIGASVFFASSIARPVINLQSLMKQVEEGNLAIRFRGKQHDEIGHLGKSFNAMIEQLQKLIDLVYQEQKSKREAEIKILQAQIKPHFLYNTLDTIRWMAHERQADDIVQLVGAITKLFRIGLSEGKELIPISEEVDHARSYLIIQKARYEEKFGYQIDFDGRLADYKVLKLTIQPLVENAIYHGIKERRGRGNILVQVLSRDGQLVLRVVDDGVGITAENLAEVRRMLLSTPGEGHDHGGFALYNVHERIQLSFGTQYGLRIYSEFGVGTTVEVVHPLVTKE
ncbi:MAG TPA: sensor histidine kinase [Spirochaetia bacterium]|nr:sensor histidine kinase [Spirochaetia bacterium]